jgi:plastocyanin
VPHGSRTIHPRRRSARGAAVAVLAVAAPRTAVGHGNSSWSGGPPPTSESSSAGETTESAPAETETIAVTAVDFSFEIDEDSFAAGTYEITLTNDGGATHDLVVERDGADVAGSEQIGPGETATFEVTLEEGEYVFYCSVGNHRSMGMEVVVQVTS